MGRLLNNQLTENIMSYDLKRDLLNVELASHGIHMGDSIDYLVEVSYEDEHCERVTGQLESGRDWANDWADYDLFEVKIKLPEGTFYLTRYMGDVTESRFFAHGPKAVTALWLSRHPITDTQRRELISMMLAGYNSPFAPERPTEVVVVEENFTFAALASVGADQIEDLVKRYGAIAVSGVIPAPIAVESATRRLTKGRPFMGFLPVAEAAAAVDGEIRYFVHSHFEKF